MSTATNTTEMLLSLDGEAGRHVWVACSPDSAEETPEEHACWRALEEFGLHSCPRPVRDQHGKRVVRVVVAHDPVAEARAELARALTRYERMASVPRHLISGIDSPQPEARRRRLRLEYSRRGRSALAWSAVHGRLQRALQTAVTVGAISPTSGEARSIRDRVIDARLHSCR